MEISSSPEFSILNDCAAGLISTDTAFERLYELYGSTVRNWARIAAGAGVADDLVQDTWVVFYSRWQSWAFSAASEVHTGRPVLSFLYRTLQFVLRGHKRRFRSEEPMEAEVESAAGNDAEKLEMTVAAQQLLERSRRICSPDELQVLLGKLAGMQGAEIAAALNITAAAVDHRYRNAVARLQQSLRRSTDG